MATKAKAKTKTTKINDDKLLARGAANMPLLSPAPPAPPVAVAPATPLPSSESPAASTPPAPPNLPNAAQIREAIGVLKAARAANVALRDKFGEIFENRWPIADPDAPDTLSDFIRGFMDDEIEISGVKMNMSLDATISDLDALIEDMEPGEKQGKWAKAIMANPVAK